MKRSAEIRGRRLPEEGTFVIAEIRKREIGVNVVKEGALPKEVSKVQSEGESSGEEAAASTAPAAAMTTVDLNY